MTDLPAGPELDARVAEALGASLVSYGTGYYIAVFPGCTVSGGINMQPVQWCDLPAGTVPDAVPAYSTDPGEAIKALEEVCKANDFVASIFTDGNKSKVDIVRSDDMRVIATETEALPLAVCRAIVSAYEAGKEA